MKSLQIKQLANGDFPDKLEEKQLKLICGGNDTASLTLATLEQYKDRLLVFYGDKGPNIFAMNLFLDLGEDNTFFQS